MEMDGIDEALKIAEAVGFLCDGLNLVVDSFSFGVGGLQAEVGEDPVHVAQ